MNNDAWCAIGRLDHLRLIGIATLLAATAMIQPGVGYGVQDAYAAGCTTEETIFMYGTNTGSSFGSTNTITNVNRPINANCPAESLLAFSTTHERLGGLTNNWAEAGWEEDHDAFGGHIFYAFTEWGINGVTRAYNKTGLPCGQFILGRNMIWDITSSGGSGAWTGSVDCNDGHGSRIIRTYTGTGYPSGYAFGETGRYGGTLSGMADTHTALYYRDVFGTWHAWTNVACLADTASDWYPSVLSGNSYKTVQGSRVC